MTFIIKSKKETTCEIFFMSGGIQTFFFFICSFYKLLEPKRIFTANIRWATAFLFIKTTVLNLKTQTMKLRLESFKNMNAIVWNYYHKTIMKQFLWLAFAKDSNISGIH